MADEELVITLIEVNGARLGTAETLLRRYLRRNGMHARIVCLACGLEIARRGMANSGPAVLVNGNIYAAGQELTPELLESISNRLLQEHAASAG